jgi:hypothetical protein
VSRHGSRRSMTVRNPSSTFAKIIYGMLSTGLIEIMPLEGGMSNV